MSGPKSERQKPEALPPQNPPAREDVTLTLFDALQATRSNQKNLARAPNPQKTIEIVGEGPQKFRPSVDPRILWGALAALVLTVVVWRVSNSTSSQSPSMANGQAERPLAPHAPASVISPAPRANAPVFGTPPPSAVRPTAIQNRPWAASPNSALANEEKEREKEREKDREYEREREREKRRQMESWKNYSEGAAGNGRTAEDNSLIEGARGYRDPAAVLRERNSGPEEIR